MFISELPDFWVGKDLGATVCLQLVIILKYHLPPVIETYHIMTWNLNFQIYNPVYSWDSYQQTVAFLSKSGSLV